MIIRPEEKQDFNEIYTVVKAAFATAEHSDGNEQDLVIALRTGNNYIQKLSLVAKIDNQLVGYIMFTTAKVGNDTVLVLAPLAILPAFQKQGIGSALINKGHQIAKELGSEHYYSRFGYLPAEQFGIKVPKGIPSINFMAKKLIFRAGKISGEVKYAKEFGI